MIHQHFKLIETFTAAENIILGLPGKEIIKMNEVVEKINGLVKAGDLGNVTYSRTNADEEVGVYQNVLTANFYINNNYTVEIEKGNFEIKSASLEGAVLTAKRRRVDL